MIDMSKLNIRTSEVFMEGGVRILRVFHVQQYLTGETEKLKLGLISFEEIWTVSSAVTGFAYDVLFAYCAALNKKKAVRGEDAKFDDKLKDLLTSPPMVVNIPL